MAIFENEGNPTQDSNFRDHLNRNWNNGNQVIEELQQTVALLQQGMGNMQSRVITLESKVHNQEIDIQQLKQAVYGTGSTGIPIEQDEFDEELKSAKEINIDYGNDE